MLVLLSFIELFFASHCKGISAGVQVEMAETALARDLPRCGAAGRARWPDSGAFACSLGQNCDPDGVLLRSYLDCAMRARRCRSIAAIWLQPRRHRSLPS